MSKQILLFKGKQEIIVLPEFTHRAEKLYNFLQEFFESKGYMCEFVETSSNRQMKQLMTEQVNYLLGHSKGATRILKEFNSASYPNMKGVIVFDPEDICEKEWNNLQISKLLLVHTINQTQNYARFNDKIVLKDDHYFNRSLEKIRTFLTKFLQS